MIELTKEQLNELTDIHIDHFRNLIEHARLGTDLGKNVRVWECQEYLAIWQDVALVLRTGGNIIGEGGREIVDALQSGEYNYIVPGSDTEWDYSFNGLKL